MARQSLGRGLSELLGDDSAAGNVFELSLDQIEPNSEQPRTSFAETALDELAQSIIANGIVQPIIVRRIGSKYQIVAGERRWRAAQRAGLHRIPVVIRQVSDDRVLELALIENIQRQDLNAIDEARAFRKLVDTIGLTQEEVAGRVGKERSLISTSLRLLKLPDEVLKYIEDETLTAGHGRALLLTDDADAQRSIAKIAIKMSLSVRETEKYIKRLSKAEIKPVHKTAVLPTIDANTISAETKLRRTLGTKVNITPNKKGSGGKMEIEYYNMDDLDRIFQLIVQSKVG